MQLPDGTAGRAVRDIGARKLEAPPAVVAARGVELRTMVRKGEQVPAQQFVEAGPCGLELVRRGAQPALRAQGVGETPVDLGVAAGQRRREQRLCIAGLTPAG